MARSRHRSGTHRRHHRLVGRIHSGVSRRFRSGRSRSDGAAGLSALSPYPHRARLRAGVDRDQCADAMVDHRRSAVGAASRAAAQGRDRRLSGQSDRHHDDGAGARRTDPMRRGCRHRLHIGRDLSRPRLCLRRRERRGPLGRRHHHQFVFQIFLHDRMADRLDGGAAGAGAGGRAAAAESRDFGADAVADRRRSGIRRARGAGRGQARL